MALQSRAAVHPQRAFRLLLWAVETLACHRAPREPHSACCSPCPGGWACAPHLVHADRLRNTVPYSQGSLNRRFLWGCSRGWKAEVRVAAGLVPPGHSLLSSAVLPLSAHSSPWVCVWVPSLLLRRTGVVAGHSPDERLGENPLSSYTQGTLGLGCQHLGFEGAPMWPIVALQRWISRTWGEGWNLPCSQG